MKKKFIAGIIAVIVIVAIAGVGSYVYFNKNSVTNNITEANTLMNEGNYTAALQDYQAVLNKDPNNTTAKSMVNIITGYISAQNDYNQGNLKEASAVLSNLTGYSSYPIANNIDTLKNDISNTEKTKGTQNINTNNMTKSSNESTIKSSTQADVKESSTAGTTTASNSVGNLNSSVSSTSQTNPVGTTANNVQSGSNETSKTQEVTSSPSNSKQEYLSELDGLTNKTNNYITGDSQAQLNGTSYQDYQMWNNEINKIWGALENKLPGSQMTSLRVDENQWIQEKERKQAEIEKQYQGGSIMPLEVNSELASMTQQRCYYLVKNYM